VDSFFVAFFLVSAVKRDAMFVGQFVFTEHHMAFTKLTSKTGAPSVSDPDVWAIFRALREAREHFGLRPGHLHTLQAMLSFLKPGQGAVIFASNQSICQRGGGIDERTLRRHISKLVQLGFLARSDSPNGKRYRVRSSDGDCISFGLSAVPLLQRARELLCLAEAAENDRQDRMFLRKQILAGLATIDNLDPGNLFTAEVRKVLRRKLSAPDHRALLSQVEAKCSNKSTAVDTSAASEMSVNNGQNDRHLSKSEKEEKDSECSETQLRITRLTVTCSEAIGFSQEPLNTWRDVERHARLIAPMMGIHAKTFDQAIVSIGHEKASAALFIVLQLGKRIRDMAAYFHSITIGSRKNQFDPGTVLERIARMDHQPA
jgi:replication initiation protein RepC